MSIIQIERNTFVSFISRMNNWK